MTENEVRLLAGLKLLAEGETRLPSAGIEARLLRQIKPAKTRWHAVLLTAAAVTLLAVFASKEFWKPKPVESDALQLASTPLTPIPYAEPLYGAEQTELVRVNIPVRQLLSWGFSASGSDPDSRVDADVLMGEDGLARAVRLVR